MITLFPYPSTITKMPSVKRVNLQKDFWNFLFNERYNNVGQVEMIGTFT